MSTSAELLEFAKNNQWEALVGQEAALAQARDAKGSTLLHYASGSGAFETCQYLLSRIDVHATSSNGRTALHWAARNGHANICVLLVQSAQIPVDIEALGDVTPLQLAVWQAHFETCQTLVELGADPHYVNGWGCGVAHWLGKCPHYGNALQQKQQQEYLAIISSKLRQMCEWLFETCQVPFIEPNHHGQTPFHKAAFAGNQPLLEYLVARGEIDHTRDHQGNTAADCAERGGHPLIAQWLRRHACPLRIQALETLEFRSNVDPLPLADMPTMEDLQQKFRQLAKLHHPDRQNGISPTSGTIKSSGSWNSIQAAYRFLQDWWQSPESYDVQVRIQTRNAALCDYPRLGWLPEWHSDMQQHDGNTPVGYSRVQGISTSTTAEEVTDANGSSSQALALEEFERRLVRLLSTQAHCDKGIALAQLPKEYAKTWHSELPNPKDFGCRKLTHLLQRKCPHLELSIDPTGKAQPRVYVTSSINRNS